MILTCARTCIVAVAALTSAAGLPLQAEARVWIVDADGSGDFADIQQAVEAASDGDVLLLRSDFEVIGQIDGAIRIEGKGLTIVGQGSRRTVRQTATFFAPFVIANLPTNSSVLLLDLDLSADPVGSLGSPATEIVRIEDCQGVVWIENCEIGGPGDLGVRWRAATVLDSSAVVMTRCRLEPHEPLWGNFSSTPALWSVRSTIFAYDSYFEGMRGLVYGSIESDGGSGIELVDSTELRLSACEAVGGDGNGTPCPIGCGQAGSGGHGLFVSASSAATILASTFAGGNGGAGCEPLCPSGFDGKDILSDGSTVTVDGESRSYRLEPAGFGYLKLNVSGSPGERVLSLRGSRPASTPLDPRHGTLLVAPPLDLVDEGTIPASGVLTKLVPRATGSPANGVPIEYRQGLFVDPDYRQNGRVRLSNGTVLVPVAGRAN